MIYFLDGNQEVIKIVRSSAVISAIQTQELPEDNSLLRDYLSVRLKNDERLFNAQYMAIKSYGGNRNAFDLYRIASEIVPDNATEFMGVQVAPYELEGVVIEDLRPTNRPLNQTMNQVLTDSDWRLGYVADNLPAITTTFYYVSAKDALKSIQELASVEMIFKVEISGNKITDKWVEVYHQLGNRTMKRFNYGTNALSVVRESSHDELYTALIGRGKGEEVGETESGDATYGRKINFANVEWKKSAGKPVDKPKGQKYIELPNATAEYGIKLLDGRKVPRIGIVEFSDTDDPEKLIQETYQELLVRARPKVLFKASVINIGDVLIGDTVTIHRHDLDFHYQARVRKVVRDRKNNNKTQVEIGDVVHTPSTKRQGQINSALNNVASDLENVRGEITEARSSADGKNVNNYGNVEPNRKKVGDTWFRDHPSLTGESQILVWNGEAWELIMDTSDTTKNADAIKEQQKEIDLAKEVADEALSEIDVAIRNAGFTSLDDTIKNVQSRANTAFDTANDLIGEVSDYQLTVDGFNQTVNNYTNQVANFRSDVDGFSSTVASYSEAVEGYATQVSTLTNTVSGFNSTVANIDGRVSTLSNTVAGVSSIVSGYDDRISTVEQTASGLQTTVASKASQTQVTQLADGFRVFTGSINTVNKNLADRWLSQRINNDGTSFNSTFSRATPMTKIPDNVTHLTVEDGSWGGWAQSAFFWYKNNSDSGYLGKYDLATNEDPGENIVTVEIPSNAKYFRYHTFFNMSEETKIEIGTEATGLYYDDSEIKSEISVLNNNINLRVTKGELMSQINIEAGRTLIQSNKLYLDAESVVFSGKAFIPSAVIESLTADKVTTGTLDAADVSIINLNAESIATGTLQGIRVEADEGLIGDWELGGGVLHSPLLSGGYTTLKATGNVAFATKSDSPYSTTGAGLQIWHDGQLRWNYGRGIITEGVVGGSNYFMLHSNAYIHIKPNFTTWHEGHLHPWSGRGDWSLGNAGSRWVGIALQSQPNVSSDVRDKKLIQDIPKDLLDHLIEIKPKMYQQKDEWHFGYIAQDVERAIYRYVTSMKKWDNMEDMNEYARSFAMLHKDESKLSLLYGEIAVIKEAEMQERMDRLENKLEELLNAN